MHMNWAQILSTPGTSLLMMLMGGASYVLWSLTYLLIIRQASKDKIYGMPFAAMCFNFTWEFIYTFVVPPTGKGCLFFWLPLLNYAIWLALDAGIVGTWLKYWRADAPPGLSSKWHVPALAMGMISAAAVLLRMQSQFNQPPCLPTGSLIPAGAVAAYLQNLLMSALFVEMVLRRNSAAGQSLPIALSKLLGTALGSIFFYNYFKAQDSYWVTLYVLCFLYDSLYVVLLLKFRRGPLTAQA